MVTQRERLEEQKMFGFVQTSALIPSADRPRILAFAKKLRAEEFRRILDKGGEEALKFLADKNIPSIGAYYGLPEEVVATLKEHHIYLNKRISQLTSRRYSSEVEDLMFCATTVVEAYELSVAVEDALAEHEA